MRCFCSRKDGKSYPDALSSLWNATMEIRRSQIDVHACQNFVRSLLKLLPLHISQTIRSSGVYGSRDRGAPLQRDLDIEILCIGSRIRTAHSLRMFFNMN